MNEDPMLATSCWSQEGADAILRTEALKGSGGVFLATHTPIRDFSVTGSERTSIVEPSEEGVLEALADPRRRHAFAVVRGEPGSGKSHLIRWLSVEWPRENGKDIVLLLQRASANLEGSLRELRSKLSSTAPAYASIIGDLGTRQTKSFEGKLADFISKLTNSLRPDYLENPPSDVGFCQSNSPADILASPPVQRSWQAPRRVLRIMTNEDGTRDSETAAFSPYEMPDLVRFKADVHSVKAQQLLNRINHESTVLEELRAAEWAADEVLLQHAEKAPFSIGLTRALNARTNAAIQESLGVPATKLKEIFFELRRAMKRDGRRLVLLLEDITAFQGLDDALIDVLVADSNTNDELCDQISVVGLTPNYYRDHLQANYNQRITHNISLGDAADGSLEDVASFRSAEARSTFVATYLSAARAGPEAIEAWAARSRANGDRGAPPNPCDACARRPDCHAVFGARGGIGLFPFTEQAVQTFFSALKTSHDGGNWQTPRGMIQGVLTPTLTRPQVLDAGRYPGNEVTGHDALDLSASSVHQTIVQRLSGIDDAESRDRSKRLIAFWGNRKDPTTTKIGEIASYAGVSQPIFERFGLPWIGADEPIEESTTPREPAGDIAEPPESRAFPTPPVGSGQQPSGPASHQNPSRPNSPRNAPNDPRAVRQRMKVKPSEHAQLMSERDEFKRSGTQLSQLWDRLAHDLVKRLDPRRLDATPVLFDALFGENRVKLEGTTNRKHNSYFVLPAKDWAFGALMAISESRQPGFARSPAAVRDANRRTIATAIRLVEALARQHIQNRSPIVDGSRLNLAHVIAAILTVRAWLRGDVSPLAPLAEQWAAILREERDPKTDPKTRVDSWDGTLLLTNAHHSKFREQLRQAVELTQGRGTGALMDAAEGVSAISRLVGSFKMPEPLADDASDDFDDIFDYPMNILTDTSSKIGRLPRAEFDRLLEASKSIDRMLRGRAVDAHLERLDRSITETDGKLPLKPQAVDRWKQDLARARQSMSPERVDAIEASMEHFLDNPAPAEKRAEILALVAAQPAAALAEIKSLLEVGEKALQLLADAARDHIGTQRANALTLPQLNAIGADCRRLAEEALAALGGEE